MIKVVAKFKVKIDYTQAFIDLAAPLVHETCKENGCIEYQLWQDEADSRTLTFIECWASDQALDIHGQSKHFQEIVPQLINLTEGEPEVCRMRLVL
jgi:quinol monooxygenase YgiN